MTPLGKTGFVKSKMQSNFATGAIESAISKMINKSGPRFWKS